MHEKTNRGRPQHLLPPRRRPRAGLHDHDHCANHVSCLAKYAAALAAFAALLLVR